MGVYRLQNKLEKMSVHTRISHVSCRETEPRYTTFRSTGLLFLLWQSRLVRSDEQYSAGGRAGEIASGYIGPVTAYTV